MLKYIEEFGKYVEITGFRDVAINDAKSFLGCLDPVCPRDFEVQLFDADLVASWQHLYFALLNALLAFRSRRNLSKSISLETLLYASSQRQIKKALEFMGVKPTSKNIGVIAVSENADSSRAAVAAVAKSLGTETDESVLDLSEAKIKRIRGAFEISELEFETVAAKGCSGQGFVDLIIERVALLSTRL